MNTGCKSSVCKTDLQIVGELRNFETPMIIGRTKNVSIHYTILNHGEPAYSTQLLMVISNSIKYATIPSSCTRGRNEEELICNIRPNKPLKYGEKFELKIILDLSKCKENMVIATANVSSSGVEESRENNLASLNLTLEEHSVVEVIR